MFRSPFVNDFVALRDTVDSLVNQAFTGDQYRTVYSRGNGRGVVQALPLDVYATEDQAVLLAAIPGMSPDSLELTVHQNTVTVAGTVSDVRDADEAKGATWYLQELWSGEVRRSVTLPFPVDADKTQASFEHGILRVVLPKAETAKARKIAIGGSQQPTAITPGETESN